MHMVIFTTAEGKPGYFQTETLEDSLKFVERVRNSEGVEDAKLFRMTEIPLQVKTYVRVELAVGAEVPVSNGSAPEVEEPVTY